VPIHGEINTISGGFSGGGCSAFKHKKYAQEVITVEAREPDQLADPDLYFTRADRVLIDQGSSVDAMFWVTFHKLKLSPDQLRPYDGCLFGFAEDQVEVRGHVKLRTTFSDGTYLAQSVSGIWLLTQFWLIICFWADPPSTA